MRRDFHPSDVDWSQVNRTIDGIDCRELARRYNVQIESQNGDEWRVYCPAHHDPPSPACDISSEGVHCFSCGFEGGVLTLFNELAGLGCDLDDPVQRDAAKVELAQAEGIDPFRERDESSPNSSTMTRPTPDPSVSASPAGPASSSADDQGAPALSDPSPIRREIIGRLYRAVEPMGLSCKAREWLRDRGIRPSTAIAYGWRDWRQQREIILDILDDYGPDALLQAGLVGQSSDGDLYGWKPLRGLKEQRQDTRGIMIPIWHPDHAEPVALRFRPYRPDEYKRHGCKSDDQPSSHLDNWTPPPLGLRGPTPEMYMMMALRDDTWPHTILTTEVKRDWLGTQTTPPDPDDTPRRLDRYPGDWFAIICEGETDMLAVADAARELAGPRLVPVALTRKASPISERVRSLVARADHIHMALDTPDESPDDKRPTWRDRYDEIARTVLLRHGTDEGEQRLSSQPVFESHDLNDFHQDNELTTYLQRYLEVSR